MSNGNAAAGTQERTDYDQLASLDRTEQLRQVIDRTMDVQRALLSWNEAWVRLVLPGATTIWQRATDR